MTALRCLPGLSRSSTITTARGELERAWQRLVDAQSAFAGLRLGDTDELFRRRDAWVRAIGEYESARLALETAFARSEGRRVLRVARVE